MPYLILQTNVNDGGCSVSVFESPEEVIKELTDNDLIGDEIVHEPKHISLEELRSEDWESGEKFFVGYLTECKVAPVTVVTKYELVQVD